MVAIEINPVWWGRRRTGFGPPSEARVAAGGGGRDGNGRCNSRVVSDLVFTKGSNP
jgi:hypothetical protein